MKKNIIVIIQIALIVLCLTSISIAGSANLTIVHENPNLKVVKYIIKYGPIEQSNPDAYPNIMEISPDGSPVLGKSTLLSDLGDGKSGAFYFTVKDIYEDGSETEFSESSFPILIPSKTLNLRTE